MPPQEESEFSDSSSESGDLARGVADPAVDAQILNAFKALRENDPSLYDSSVRFIGADAAFVPSVPTSFGQPDLATLPPRQQEEALRQQFIKTAEAVADELDDDLFEVVPEADAAHNTAEEREAYAAWLAAELSRAEKARKKEQAAAARTRARIAADAEAEAVADAHAETAPQTTAPAEHKSSVGTDGAFTPAAAQFLQDYLLRRRWEDGAETAPADAESSDSDAADHFEEAFNRRREDPEALARFRIVTHSRLDRGSGLRQPSQRQQKRQEERQRRQTAAAAQATDDARKKKEATNEQRRELTARLTGAISAVDADPELAGELEALLADGAAAESLAMRLLAAADSDEWDEDAHDDMMAALGAKLAEDEAVAQLVDNLVTGHVLEDEDPNARFKYHEVEAENYGLSAAEILQLDDSELNRRVPLSRLAAYAPSRVAQARAGPRAGSKRAAPQATVATAATGSEAQDSEPADSPSKQSNAPAASEAEAWPTDSMFCGIRVPEDLNPTTEGLSNREKNRRRHKLSAWKQQQLGSAKTRAGKRHRDRTGGKYRRAEATGIARDRLAAYHKK
jgi:hypothetical protein